jgi:dihydrofolate reductase
MNEIPKAVFTKKGFKGIDPGPDASPAAASWAGARVFDGDLAEGIRELKAGQGKPIVAIGGAGFMQSLIATGLVDEYVRPYIPLHWTRGYQFSPVFKNHFT